jgi:hypothetical protein
MRNKIFFFTLLSFVFALTSCQEDGIVFPNIQNVAGSFRVIIDGALFSTENVSFTSENEEIVITATKTDTNEIITLNIDNFSIGSFSFEGENTSASYATNADVWSTINATSSRGNIEFTDIDFSKNTISGTFSFIGNHQVNGGSKAFISGVFNEVPLF